MTGALALELGPSLFARLVGALSVRRDEPALGAVGGAARRDEGDLDLVARCLAGERGAFDELYRRHASAIHGRLTRLAGRGPDTDDLVQKVFLEAFRSLARFRGEAAFATWLHRIAIHVAMGALRGRRRAPWSTLPPDELEAVSPVDLATPERAFAERELLERALAELGRLKPKHRIAFVLRHVEGLDYQEIGELVGANPPAVAQRVKKAERELQLRLGRGGLA